MLLAYEALNGRSGHEVGHALLAKLYREATKANCPDFHLNDPKIQIIDGCYVAIVEEYHAF